MPRHFIDQQKGQLVDACKRCDLSVCNVKSAGCEYAAIIRRWNGQDYEQRRSYHETYYEQNKATKIAAAKARYAAKRFANSGDGQQADQVLAGVNIE